MEAKVSRLEVKDLVSERRVDGAMVFLCILLFVAWHAMTHGMTHIIFVLEMPKCHKQ